MSTLLAQIQTWAPKAEEFLRISPELAWVGALCLVMITPLIVGRRAKTVGAAALVGILVIGFFTLKVWSLVADGGLTALSPPTAGGMLIVDSMSVFYKLILLVFLIGVTLLWWFCSADRETDAPEFFVLLMGSALGMALMTSTLNLLMMVVAIEFASLPSYAIVGFEKRNRLAAEASLKYVVFGAVCAAIMLYGATLLYGFFGTLDVSIIAQGAGDRFATPGPDRLLIGIAMFCVFAGIAFKISAVPFHFWCPDAFQGAKVEVTTWLSVASKAAGLLLLLRIVHAFSPYLSTSSAMAPAIVIGILASVTCTVGNLAAYWQRSVKRMLAYSSIAHAGYMLMAAAIIAAPSDAPTFPAISAVIGYIVVYMFMNLGAFGVTALLVRANGGDDSITAFSGLIRRAPALALAMLFCLVSLVGLPPFAGFLVKYYLLAALGEAGSMLHWTLVVVAVVNTLISLWFYMRVVVQMMLKDDGESEIDVPAGGSILVNFCGAVLLLLLIFGSPLKNYTDAIAAKLYRGPGLIEKAPESAVVLAEPESSR